MTGASVPLSVSTLTLGYLTSASDVSSDLAHAGFFFFLSSELLISTA